jgi:prepilin-type N-terminal cleavage/methylation domain-containing protein
MKISSRGFTLVEIMVSLGIIAVLFGALYAGGIQPYMKRARDTKRITALLTYSNVLDTYEKNFDTFPSNY